MGFLHYLYFYFGLLLVGGFGAAGDVWLYHWGRYRDWVSLFIGLGLWLGSLLTFGMLVRYGERSLSATFILGAVLHIGAVIAWDYYREGTRLSSIEWLGIFFAGLGVVLVEYGRANVEGTP